VNLRDGVQGVRDKVGEGKPWLFDTNTIIADLNRSARSMTSAAQAIRDTYAYQTQPNPTAGAGVYYQEYQMPQNCEMIIAAKIKIGILYPLNLNYTQQQLQVFGYVASTPFAGYIRRGITLTQQVPGSSEIVMPAPGNKAGVAEWVLGFYPTPSGVFPFFVDYVAYHPVMQAPMDLCLIPDRSDFYDAWIAYSISNCMEKMGDQVTADRYKKIHNAGLDQYSTYMFASQAQVTPPMYGAGNQPANLNPYAAVMAPTAGNLTIEGA